MSFESPPENTGRGPSKNAPLHRLPRPSGRPLQQIIDEYIRPDGGRGLRVRELTAAMHIAAETLTLAIAQPERLSMTSLFGLAKLMGIASGQIVADVAYQVRQQWQGNALPYTPQPRGRRARPTVSDTATGREPAPPAGLKTDPSLPLVKEALQAMAADSLITAGEPDPQQAPDEGEASAAAPLQQVAYADATFEQRSLALASVTDAFANYLPTVPWLRWVKALDTLQPTLWLEQEQEQQHVSLGQPEREQLIQYLAGTSEMPPPPERPVYVPQALYLARRHIDLGYMAVLALAELEQNPHAFGIYMRALIFKLVAGNGVAEEVSRVFDGCNFPDRSLPADQLPGSPSVMARLNRLNRSYPGPGGGLLRPSQPSS